MGGQEGGRAHKGRAKASKENGSKPTSSLDNLMKLMASDFSGVVVEETHHQEAGTGADREAGAEQCGSQEGGVQVDSPLWHLTGWCPCTCLTCWWMRQGWAGK